MHWLCEICIHSQRSISPSGSLPTCAPSPELGRSLYAAEGQMAEMPGMFRGLLPWLNRAAPSLRSLLLWTFRNDVGSFSSKDRAVPVPSQTCLLPLGASWDHWDRAGGDEKQTLRKCLLFLFLFSLFVLLFFWPFFCPPKHV